MGLGKEEAEAFVKVGFFEENSQVSALLLFDLMSQIHLP